jgi:hypothetical protein
MAGRDIAGRQRGALLVAVTLSRGPQLEAVP